MRNNFIVKEISIRNPKNSDLLIDGITFEIGQGEIFSLIGESGSGKTTILGTIVGKYNSLLKSEEIDYYGKKFNDEVFIGDISYIPQNYPLFDEVSVEENVIVSFRNSVNYYLCLYPELKHDDVKFEKDILKNIRKFVKKNGLKKDLNNLNKSISDVFESLNLSYSEIKKRKPNQLSGGQRQRLSIACSLLKKPKLVIMDEPFANLDSKTSLDIMEYILELKEQGVSFLIATHDIDIISGHEDNSILLSGKGDWVEGTIDFFKKERMKEWIVSYFTPYYNLINGKFVLFNEIEISKTKTPIKGEVKFCKKWKDTYKITMNIDGSDVFFINDNPIEIGKNIYIKI